MFELLFRHLSPEKIMDLQNVRKFVINNNIIGTAVGVVIAYSFWDLIKSFVGDILLPSFYFIFIHWFIKNEFISSVFESVNKINIPKFINSCISTAFVIISTFLIIQHIVNNWAGIDTNTITPQPKHISQQEQQPTQKTAIHNPIPSQQQIQAQPLQPLQPSWSRRLE
jgi:large-conductance mechanosensitive channel